MLIFLRSLERHHSSSSMKPHGRRDQWMFVSYFLEKRKSSKLATVQCFTMYFLMEGVMVLTFEAFRAEPRLILIGSCRDLTRNIPRYSQPRSYSERIETFPLAAFCLALVKLEVKYAITTPIEHAREYKAST